MCITSGGSTLKNAKKKPRSSFPGATCAQTHAYVCRCRHCCEGYDAGAFVLRSWGVWSENARKEVSRNTVGVCVEPICIELMVCVCVVLVGVQI